MTWIVEVQHSSDQALDGVWHELERVESEASAAMLIDYFGTEKPIPKGLRPEQCVITGGYAGRPLRKREIA